ncbi:MAG TPA: peptidoglycan-binding domain-containing protein [Roseiarcus sp.]|nr:peptidoglycan-binding domain-containing protein [Roseiarcus sp.]
MAQAVIRRLAARPSRTIAGAAFAAIMTGIVINALFLQKTHRFAVIAPPASTAPVRPPPAAAPPTQAAAPSEAAPAPPARPADLGALIEAAAAPHAGDPIRDLLRAEPAAKESGEAKRLTLAAQNALIKLGFAIKADGVDGASTRQAIQQFERAHGFIPLGEITPKLVRQLTAAASEAGR